MFELRDMEISYYYFFNLLIIVSLNYVSICMLGPLGTERGGDMDINFRLFSERLGRVLAGEEVTLPDAAKQPIQNLHAEVEIVTSWLCEFEDDISCLLMQKNRRS